MSTTTSSTNADCLLSLATAIETEVKLIFKDANCGVAANWLPILSLALLDGKDDTSKMISDMAKSTLPKDMQNIPGLELLMQSLDPTNDLNKDADTKIELFKIFSKEDNQISKALANISMENGLDNFRLALQVLTKINSFIKGTEAPQPRGRPPAGMVWNGHVESWVDDENTIQNTPKKEAKKEAKKLIAKKAPDSPETEKKRPVGRPPVGKKWDPIEGIYVADPEHITSSSSEEPKSAPKSDAKKRPVGRPPADKEWDAELGIYTKKQKQ